MKSLSLPKSALLLKSWQYRLVYGQGKRLRGQGFSLVFLPTQTGESRLGISVHGMDRAVRRNRVKRIIREFFRLNRAFMDPPADVIFAVRAEWALNSPMQVAEAVHRMLTTGKVQPPRRNGGAGQGGRTSVGTGIGQEKGGS